MVVNDFIKDDDHPTSQVWTSIMFTNL
jgi:hypothetical protein